MIYPIKTLSQLPLILKGFRKEKGLTQTDMAKKLGISQQSYAHFEANPTTATLERLFVVLRMLDVEISLDQLSSTTSKSSAPSVTPGGQRPYRIETIIHTPKSSKTSKVKATASTKPTKVTKVGRIAHPTRKKESW